MAAKNARNKRKCKNKVAYDTHEAAQRALIRLRKSNPLGLKYNIYICKYCGKRHVGHRPTKYSNL